MTPRIYIQNMGPDIGIVLTANQNMVNLSINYKARRGAKQKKVKSDRTGLATSIRTVNISESFLKSERTRTG